MNNFDDVYIEWRQMPFSKEIVKLYFWSSWAPAPLSPLICMTSPLHFPDTPYLFSFKMPSPRTPPSDLSNQCSLRGSTCTHVTIYVISSIHEVTACILEHAIISDSTFLSNQPIISSLVTKGLEIQWYMYIVWSLWCISSL